MNDLIRENLSYFDIYKGVLTAEKTVKPERIQYAKGRERCFLYYEPRIVKRDKVIVWVHGGGWNSFEPAFFDFVGQCIAKAGYRFVSVGYRLSPLNKYPRQIVDVCRGYEKAVYFLNSRGIDTTEIVLTGSSAGAHLASILCYGKNVTKRLGIDTSGIIGFIGLGGPYSFSVKTGLPMRTLIDMLFPIGYDRKKGEPLFLMEKSPIPMLLIQSRHDGLINFHCAESMRQKAAELGNSCEIYEVTGKKDTHSWYTAGLFLDTRENDPTLDRFFSWIEKL